HWQRHQERQIELAASGQSREARDQCAEPREEGHVGAQRPSHQGRAERDQSSAEPGQQEHLQRQASQAVGRRGGTKSKEKDSRRLAAAFLLPAGAAVGLADSKRQKKTAGRNSQPSLGAPSSEFTS